MRKASLFHIVCLFVLLSVGIQSAKPQYTSDGKAFPLASGINIISPSNKTYRSNIPVLNVTIKSMLPPSMYQYEVTYSLDEQENVTLQIAVTNVPVEATVTYPNGTTETRISVFGSYYLISGLASLPKLAEGLHEITVYGKYKRTFTENPNLPMLILDNKTVYFTMNYGIPPVITTLSIENTTYTQNHLLLNFTTNEPISWMGYSLDEKATTTIAGNATLTELGDGSHNITIYANDTVGNMGISRKVYFSIKVMQQETLQATIVGASASAVVIGIGLAVVFRKRN